MSHLVTTKLQEMLSVPTDMENVSGTFLLTDDLSVVQNMNCRAYHRGIRCGPLEAACGSPMTVSKPCCIPPPVSDLPTEEQPEAAVRNTSEKMKTAEALVKQLLELWKVPTLC
jgi:hypothetical protein